MKMGMNSPKWHETIKSPSIKKRANTIKERKALRVRFTSYISSNYFHQRGDEKRCKLCIDGYK